MEQIVVHIKDESKIELLIGLLTSLDFVDTVDTVIDGGETADVKRKIDENSAADFFNLAGLWSGRDIDVDALRHLAWPRQSQ